MNRQQSSDNGERSGGRRLPSSIPHVGRAAKWLIGTVLTAAIGLGVAALAGGGSSGDESGQPPGDKQEKTIPFPPSRLVSSERIGLYHVEENGTSEGALNALGQPSKRERPAGTCVMTWNQEQLTMNFGNLAGANPCRYGSFCDATIGRGWATTKGLEVGESVRRLRELYPRAMRLHSGASDVYVLEEGTQLCGRDVKGGLEAWAGSGNVYALHVSFMAGGD
jgi:hypothetical protein